MSYELQMANWHNGRVHIAFATAAPFRDHDEDLPLLIAAAKARGHRAELVNWYDPAVEWPSFDTVVVRSCWDYIDRLDEFIAWARSIPSLQNPSTVIAWNTDKVYLREVAGEGIAIIPTYWNVQEGDDIGDSEEWVCKPSISVGSLDTGRWGSREEVYAHSADLVAAGRASIVQPYITSVDTDGETAMLFIGGEFSHSIRKGQLLFAGEGINDERAGTESITPRAPTAVQHEVAAEALEAVARILSLDEPLLYARVDLVTAPNGSPLVIELELTEPSLFLPHTEDGADRLIRALES